MKSIKSFRRNVVMIAICFAATAAFSACDRSEDNPDSRLPEVLMQDANVNVAVYDIDGKPLAGVSVSTGTYKTATESDGKYTFSEAGTVNGRAVIHFEKEGYFPLTRSAVIDSDGEITMHVILYRKGTNAGVSLQADFDANSAQMLKIGEMTVILPAGSVAQADGSAYSGKVRADMLYIAPGNKNAALMMPGGDLSTNKSNDDILEPCGITDLLLTGTAGQPLKIRDNTSVDISFPAYAGVTDASLPLWSFSDDRGVWMEDGSLARQGSAYKGTVKHFSSKAPGKSQKKCVISAQVFVCDKPESGVEVKIEEDHGEIVDLVPYRGTTNTKGNCRVAVSTKRGHIVTVVYNGESQSQTVPANSNGLNSLVFKFNDDCDGYGVVEAYGKKYPLHTCYVLIEGADPDQVSEGDNLYSIAFESRNLKTDVFVVITAKRSGTGVPSGTYSDADVTTTEYHLDEKLITTPWGRIKDLTMEVKGNNISITGSVAACYLCPTPTPTTIKVRWNGPIRVEKAYE